jgi:hypothetical protein
LVGGGGAPQKCTVHISGLVRKEIFYLLKK